MPSFRDYVRDYLPFRILRPIPARLPNTEEELLAWLASNVWSPVDPRSNDVDVMLFAAWHGWNEAIEYLVDAGGGANQDNNVWCDYDRADHDPDVSMTAAVRMGRYETVVLLVDVHGFIVVDAHVEDAALEKHWRMARFLMDRLSCCEDDARHGIIKHEAARERLGRVARLARIVGAFARYLIADFNRVRYQPGGVGFKRARAEWEAAKRLQASRS